MPRRKAAVDWTYILPGACGVKCVRCNAVHPIRPLISADLFARKVAAFQVLHEDCTAPPAHKGERPAPDPAECVGHERGGAGKCCERAGEYNGFGSDGPTIFTCPKSCSCHD